MCVITCLVLVACDGEITSSASSFSGTVSSSFNGVIAEETFSFDKSTGVEAFDANMVRLYRSGPNGSNFRLSLIIDEATGTISIHPRDSSHFVLFSTQVDNRKFATRIYARPIRYFFPVGRQHTQYPFKFEFVEHNALADYSLAKIIEDYGYPTQANETVYFSGGWPSPWWEHNNYGYFTRIVYADGSSSRSSSTYGGLRLNVGNVPFGNALIIRAPDGRDLSSFDTVEPDKFTFEDYSYDEQTGLMRFKFNITTQGYPRPNSTGSPINIAGDFAGKVLRRIN
jgi:hypothetical protein